MLQSDHLNYCKRYAVQRLIERSCVDWKVRIHKKTQHKSAAHSNAKFAVNFGESWIFKSWSLTSSFSHRSRDCVCLALLHSKPPATQPNSNTQHTQTQKLIHDPNTGGCCVDRYLIVFRDDLCSNYLCRDFAI